MLYQIKHRDAKAVLYEWDCKSVKECVESAVAAGVSLAHANLEGANLEGADLRDANLRRTYLIDAGYETRGYRFWAWRRKDNAIIYRAGCHEWDNITEALEYFSQGYTSTGNRHECLARLNLLVALAAIRWATA